MNPEALEFWKRALQALQTAEELVDRDPDASSSRAYYAAFFAVSAGAAFSWLATLRYTADYGGTDHVQPSEAKEAVEKAKSILQAVRNSMAGAFPEPGA